MLKKIGAQNQTHLKQRVWHLPGPLVPKCSSASSAVAHRSFWLLHSPPQGPSGPLLIIGPLRLKAEKNCRMTYPRCFFAPWFVSAAGFLHSPYIIYRKASTRPLRYAWTRMMLRQYANLRQQFHMFSHHSSKMHYFIHSSSGTAHTTATPNSRGFESECFTLCYFVHPPITKTIWYLLSSCYKQLAVLPLWKL